MRVLKHSSPNVFVCYIPRAIPLAYTVCTVSLWASFLACSSCDFQTMAVKIKFMSKMFDVTRTASSRKLNKNPKLSCLAAQREIGRSVAVTMRPM